MFLLTVAYKNVLSLTVVVGVVDVELGVVDVLVEVGVVDVLVEVGVVEVDVLVLLKCFVFINCCL